MAFRKQDIFDWSYFDNGKLKGNATGCPLLLKAPEEQRHYSLNVLGMEC